MGQCLKCGKETAEKAIFCQQCQDDMGKYPVKPGTVIHLPKRQSIPEKKAELYDEPDHEKQIHGLRKTVRFLAALVAALSILLTITAFMLLRTMSQEKPVAPIGRNYTTVHTTP